MRKPPATLRWTSCVPSLTPQCASSTARTMDSRFWSQPTTARRGVPSEVGATRAWISTSSGRVPSIPANTAQPGARHLEHADFVGRAETVLDRAQDAELVRALALEGQDRVHHVLDDARAGDGPFLGDVTDQYHGSARALGE